MNLKLLLVALYKALTIQFKSAPHFIEHELTNKAGDTVSFNSADGASISYVKLEDKKAEGGYVLRVQIGVPKGPGMRVPASVSVQTTDVRNRMAAIIKDGFQSYDLKEDDGIEVVIPVQAGN